MTIMFTGTHPSAPLTASCLASSPATPFPPSCPALHSHAATLYETRKPAANSFRSGVAHCAVGPYTSLVSAWPQPSYACARQCDVLTLFGPSCEDLSGSGPLHVLTPCQRLSQPALCCAKAGTRCCTNQRGVLWLFGMDIANTCEVHPRMRVQSSPQGPLSHALLVP